MVTRAQMKKIAMSMPEAEERSHFGQPDFRVRGKIFCTLAAEENRGTVKIDPELQSVLLAANPKGFSPAPGAWGKRGWTFVHLAHVTIKELRPLIVASWRATAPKRLVQATES
jgi:hypothetical protein